MRKHRNGNIEILRFLFSVCILLGHLSRNILHNSSMGVEFFFIVSGYFLAAHIYSVRKENETMREIAQGGLSYIKKRAISLYPYYLPAMIFGLIVLFYTGKIKIGSLTDIGTLTAEMFGGVFLLQNLSILSISATGTMWYLSAFFFSLWILYPLVRKTYPLFLYLSLPITLFLMSDQMRRIGDFLPVVYGPDGFISSGIIRAFSMMTLGCLVYGCATFLRNCQFSKKAIVILTALEISGYILVFLFLYRGNVEWKPFIACVIAFSFCITTSVSGLKDRFSGKFSDFLGRLSMTLFMCHHHYVQSLCVYLVETYHFSWRICAIGMLILSLVTSLVVLWIGDTILRVFNKKTMKNEIN